MNTEQSGFLEPPKGDTRKLDDIILGGDKRPRTLNKGDVSVIESADNDGLELRQWFQSFVELVEKYVLEFNRVSDEDSMHVSIEKAQSHMSFTSRRVTLTVTLKVDYVESMLEDPANGSHSVLTFNLADQSDRAASILIEGAPFTLKQLPKAARKVFGILIERAGEMPEETAEPPHFLATSAEEQFKPTEKLGSLLFGLNTQKDIDEPQVNTGLSGLFQSANNIKPQPVSSESEIYQNESEVDMLETKESLASAFEHMRRAVAGELENHTRTGMKAFEVQDMAGVELAMRKVTKIKAMKEVIEDTLDQWEAELLQ